MLATASKPKALNGQGETLPQPAPSKPKALDPNRRQAQLLTLLAGSPVRVRLADGAFIAGVLEGFEQYAVFLSTHPTALPMIVFKSAIAAIEPGEVADGGTA